MANKNVIWCDEQLLQKDLTGKTYIVTGANSGVGFETTQQLVKQGAHVVMACRRVNAANEAAKDFGSLKGSYEVIPCDLADLNSVRKFAETFINKGSNLDALVCNAGFVNMTGKPEYTKDGLETTIAVSYFGHFLLTELLLEKLKESAPSRYIILSSVVHAGSPKKRHKIHLDDINYKNRKFSAFDVYSEAKVACNRYALELAERLKGSNVSAFSVHPGWARSNFGKGGSFLMTTTLKMLTPIFKMLNFSDSSWESAQTSLHCLLSDDAPNHSGKYFSQHSVLYQDKACKKGGWPMESPNPHAKDLDAAKKLVELSRKLVGLA